MPLNHQSSRKTPFPKGGTRPLDGLVRYPHQKTRPEAAFHPVPWHQSGGARLRQYFFVFASFAAVTIAAPETTPAPADLFDQFGPGWRDHWKEERFFTKPTRYETVTDAGRTVLHATSRAANAGLVRKTPQSNPTAARLRWSWKIAAPLTANHTERTRAGDDYAVRVFVVFETSVIPLRTRALNYVWAAHEPVGSVYPSPYTKNVGMIVLRSGETDAGRWCVEERDLLADYEKFFGTAPTKISAVAVLVDTDNTGLNAEAWLADLRLDPTPLPKKEKRPLAVSDGSWSLFGVATGLRACGSGMRASHSAGRDACRYSEQRQPKVRRERVEPQLPTGSSKEPEKP